MNFFELDFRKADRDYCEVRARVPCLIELLTGEAAAPSMRESNLDYLDLNMDEDKGGLKLPDKIDNTQLLLVLSNRCVELLNSNCSLTEHEIIAVHLINEKKRLHADNYCLLNLIGHVDCLDFRNSEMDADPDDPSVRAFGKYQLIGSSIPQGVDIFRVRGLIGYICNEHFKSIIESNGMTNFAFKPVQIA